MTFIEQFATKKPTSTDGYKRTVCMVCGKRTRVDLMISDVKCYKCWKPDENYVP